MLIFFFFFGFTFLFFCTWISSIRSSIFVVLYFASSFFLLVTDFHFVSVLGSDLFHSTIPFFSLSCLSLGITPSLLCHFIPGGWFLFSLLRRCSSILVL